MKIKLTEKYLSKNSIAWYLIFEIEWTFEYKSWQFIMMEMDSQEYVNLVKDKLSQEDKEKILKLPKIKRAYSIASCYPWTKETNKIAFYIKDAWWFSNFLLNQNIWFEIQINGPYGHFTNEWNNQNYLFVSVWSGIAPILSIFEEVVKYNKNYNKIVNLFWERYLDNIPEIVLNKFQEFENENVKSLIYLSKEENIPDKLFKWHIQDWLENALNFLNTKNISVFICGKSIMVDDIVEKLVNYGINKENIKTEKYW